MTRITSTVLAALLIILGGLFTPSAAEATQTVMMENYAFTPASLTVRVGDTVTWMQHDTAPHDVVTTSAPVAFRSPQLSQGQSWSYTFRTAGTYAYYCSVHPDMRAQVTVLPAATTAQPAPTAKRATPTPQRTSSAPASSAAAAPPAGTTTSAAPDSPAPTSAEQPAPSVVPQAVAQPAPSLDPMLLVAGLVTAVAVGCLLLLGSRRA
jgi:plastocyanin